MVVRRMAAPGHVVVPFSPIGTQIEALSYPGSTRDANRGSELSGVYWEIRRIQIAHREGTHGYEANLGKIWHSQGSSGPIPRNSQIGLNVKTHGNSAFSRETVVGEFLIRRRQNATRRARSTIRNSADQRQRNLARQNIRPTTRKRALNGPSGEYLPRYPVASAVHHFV